MTFSLSVFSSESRSAVTLASLTKGVPILGLAFPLVVPETMSTRSKVSVAESAAIGFVIAPLVAHVQVVFIPTLSFVKRPTVWMETVSKYRGSITFAPNFAYALAAKRAARQIKGAASSRK